MRFVGNEEIAGIVSGEIREGKDVLVVCCSFTCAEYIRRQLQAQFRYNSRDRVETEDGVRVRFKYDPLQCRGVSVDTVIVNDCITVSHRGQDLLRAAAFCERP